MIAYHDTEWGRPNHDDRYLFELLLLEGAQAGLSWSTVLNKRENYRRALDGFDFHRIARYGQAKLDELRADAGIVRNRLKISSTVKNARAFLAVREEFGTFDAYLWRWVDGTPVVTHRPPDEPLPCIAGPCPRRVRPRCRSAHRRASADPVRTAVPSGRTSSSCTHLLTAKASA